MDEPTRAVIRHLYFVERRSLRTIAETLTLAPHAVRAALVLPGGTAAQRSPEPVTAAAASLDPGPTNPIPSGVTRAASALRRATQEHR